MFLSKRTEILYSLADLLSISPKFKILCIALKIANQIKFLRNYCNKNSDILSDL